MKLLNSDSIPLKNRKSKALAKYEAVVKSIIQDIIGKIIDFVCKIVYNYINDSNILGLFIAGGKYYEK